jgi:hypothetical protein
MHDYAIRRGARSAIRPPALSPVDEEVERFIAGISALLPPPGAAPVTKSRLPNPAPNDLSIAAWLTIGDVRILLGADLEEHGVATRGWSAVLTSNTRPPGLASFFKISHHGSVTGHHDRIWLEMLEQNPAAALSAGHRRIDQARPTLALNLIRKMASIVLLPLSDMR